MEIYTVVSFAEVGIFLSRCVTVWHWFECYWAVLVGITELCARLIQTHDSLYHIYSNAIGNGRPAWHCRLCTGNSGVVLCQWLIGLLCYCCWEWVGLNCVRILQKVHTVVVMLIQCGYNSYCNLYGPTEVLEWLCVYSAKISHSKKALSCQ